jgi:hypothetical protein
MTQVTSSREAAGATFAALTPPLAVLASLSCFTLRLKPRKTGDRGASESPVGHAKIKGRFCK